MHERHTELPITQAFNQELKSIGFAQYYLKARSKFKVTKYKDSRYALFTIRVVERAANQPRARILIEDGVGKVFFDHKFKDTEVQSILHRTLAEYYKLSLYYNASK